MQVIATAGHVDHGKSALVRALTGMEPDRWAEEQRRGMTIDLGYAWLRLPSGRRLALVDVPGHARFVPNMLAGVGPVPAVLFVVSADGGWMPQSAEHLAAVDALGIRHGVLAVTRVDLADPGPALSDATERIRGSSLGAVPAIGVSSVTGTGLPELIAALDRLVAALPAADPDGPVRIWIDRVFTIAGSGTVVTGTLPAGRVSRGDRLLVTPAMREVHVRGLQALGTQVASLAGVARAALNLRGAGRADLGRGMALIRPGEWTLTGLADVRLTGPAIGGTVTVHCGSARTPARLRPLAAGLARLVLRDRLPLHVGERLLLRDPGGGAGNTPAGPAGQRWPGITGAIVLDVAPPPLARRGAARAAVAELGGWPNLPGAGDLLGRHELLRRADLAAMGIAEHPPPVAGDWVADPVHWTGLRRQLAAAVAEHAKTEPLAAGLPVRTAQRLLNLADPRLIEALAVGSGSTGDSQLRVRNGLISARDPSPDRLLPELVLTAVSAVRADLAVAPFRAPDAARLARLGLDNRALAAAANAGLLLRIGGGIVLGPQAAELATAVLAGLPQPFDVALARTALNSTRRTVVPLLEYLDRLRITERQPDDRRFVRRRP